MLAGFLTSLEFCHDVSEEDIQLITKDRPETLTESTKILTSEKKYLLFPSLVELEYPINIWQPQPYFSFHFGWVLQCTQPHHFFLPRFQSVFINRLAFRFALAAEPHHINQEIPAIQRKCSLWKRGICWGNQHGAEVLVQVDNQCKSVVLLMRSRNVTSKFLELQSNVIKTVQETAKELCPRVPTTESLLPPQEASHYPLCSVSDLTLFSVSEVDKAVYEKLDSVVSKQGKTLPLEILLSSQHKVSRVVLHR